IDRERREQRCLITTTLRRDDNVTSAWLVDRKSIALNTSIDFAEGGLLFRRGAARNGESGAFGEIGDRNGDGARPANDHLRSRQNRLNEYIHRALARAHVLGEAHPALLFAGRVALLIEQINRLDGDKTRFSVGKSILGRLEHRCA